MLRNRYASRNVVMRLSAKLYGQPQGEREGAGLFLEQRHLLARRLLPDATEEQLVSVLLESLRGSIKKLLRSSTIDSVEELIARATQIEQDEAEELRYTRRSASTVSSAPAKQVALPTAKPRSAPNASGPREIPQCHFCPERHWNRDCPVHPYRRTSENHRGAASSATQAAPDPAAQ